MILESAAQPPEFTELTDAPASYSGQAGKVPTVNGAETGLEFSAKGATAFTGLTDAPGSYSGHKGRIPTVNSTETGLEFGLPDFDRASKLGFTPHIWAGTNGYVPSASNPIIDDNDMANISGLSLSVIQAGVGCHGPVVRFHNGYYYMFLNIDAGNGGPQNRSLYLIKSLTPDFAAYTVVGQALATQAGTFYSNITYAAGLLYDPFASGIGTDKKWKMLVGVWNLATAGFTWAHADNIEGPWTIHGAGQATNPFDPGTGFGGGAELVGNMLYYVRINSGAAPYVIQVYQGNVKSFTDFSSYTPLGNLTPALSGDYANGFRFFSVFKHQDGFYLCTYNENPLGVEHPTFGNLYLLVSGRFGQDIYTVQKASPILKHGTGASDWDKQRIQSPWLLLHEDDVLLYYTGSIGNKYKIGMASLSGSY